MRTQTRIAAKTRLSTAFDHVVDPLETEVEIHAGHGRARHDAELARADHAWDVERTRCLRLELVWRRAEIATRLIARLEV